MTTQIDLSKFCDPDSSRYSIQTPFVQAGFRYSTDGRVLVEVPAPGEPDSCEPDKRYPQCAPLLNGFELVKEFHPLPDAPDCNDCHGSGYSDCKDCGGRGEHECSCGHEHECQSCDDGKQICGCFATFPPHDVATHYTELLRTLPNCEWGCPPKNKRGVIFLRFDGGRGAIMPLDPKRMKGRNQ